MALLVEEYGSVLALANAIYRSDSQVSQWLNASINSGTGKPRGMRSDSCRHIERSTGKSKGWMDTRHDEVVPISGTTLSAPSSGYVRLEHLSPSPSMGPGAAISEPVQIVQYLDVLEQWVRQEVGTTNPARVKVLTGNGNSMAPTIKDKDLVFVDVECRSIEMAGIYVLDVAGRLILKKAMILASGTLVIRSDNVAEYPDEEKYDLRHAGDSITVCGKVLAWWTLGKA